MFLPKRGKEFAINFGYKKVINFIQRFWNVLFGVLTWFGLDCLFSRANSIPIYSCLVAKFQFGANFDGLMWAVASQWPHLDKRTELYPFSYFLRCFCFVLCVYLSVCVLGFCLIWFLSEGRGGGGEMVFSCECLFVVFFSLSSIFSS